MKKIAMVLTNAFNPDVRVYKEAKYFVEQGHEVTIYAWDRKCECKECEEVDGIKVKRIQVESVAGSGAKQILPSIKFMNELKKILNKAEYDILYCHDLDGAIAGYFVGNKKTTFVFDMHEIYNDYFYYRIPLIGKSLFKRLINYSNHIVYVNEKQIENFERNNLKKSIYIPNYPVKGMYVPIEKENSNKLRVNYIGAVRDYDSLNTLLSIENGEIEIKVYGMGTAYDKLKMDHYGNNSKLIGRYDGIKESGEIYRNTDILYCVYDPNIENWKMAYPVKLFEAIITRTPIIVCKGTNLEAFVNKYGIGLAVEYGNKDELLECIFKIRENYTSYVENIKRIENNYNWENTISNLNIMIKQKIK